MKRVALALAAAACAPAGSVALNAEYEELGQ